MKTLRVRMGEYTLFLAKSEVYSHKTVVTVEGEDSVSSLYIPISFERIDESVSNGRFPEDIDNTLKDAILKTRVY